MVGYLSHHPPLINKKITFAVVRPSDEVQSRYGWVTYHGLGLQEVKLKLLYFLCKSFLINCHGVIAGDHFITCFNKKSIFVLGLN